MPSCRSWRAPPPPRPPPDGATRPAGPRPAPRAPAPARRYIAALLLCLGAMLHLELPHVNVLSKVDLVRHYGRLGGEIGTQRGVTRPCRRSRHLACAKESGALPGKRASDLQPRQICSPIKTTRRRTPAALRLRRHRPPDFSLDYYTQVQDLSYLVRAMGHDKFGAKHRWAARLDDIDAQILSVQIQAGAQIDQTPLLLLLAPSRPLLQPQPHPPPSPPALARRSPSRLQQAEPSAV